MGDSTPEITCKMLHFETSCAGQYIIHILVTGVECRKSNFLLEHVMLVVRFHAAVISVFPEVHRYYQIRLNMSWMISYSTNSNFVALWGAYVNTVSLRCNVTVVFVTAAFSEVFQFHKLFYIKSHIPNRNKHGHLLYDFATGTLFPNCVLLKKYFLYWRICFFWLLLVVCWFFLFQSSQNNTPEIYTKILCFFPSLKFKFLVFIVKCLRGFILFISLSLSRINVVQFSLT